MSSTVKVEEQYHDYSPPVDVYRSVRLLLRFVPKEHLVGLHRVVLTNSDEVGKRVRGKIVSEKRRIRPADCAGLYSEGRVLLLVDRIFQRYPEWFLLFPPFKTYVIAETLYHEIGHHIHRLEQPGYRSDKETVADQWKEQLMRGFLIQRYWYLAKLVRAYATVASLWQGSKGPIKSVVLSIIFVFCSCSTVVLACSGNGAGEWIEHNRSVVQICAVLSAAFLTASVVLFFLRQRKGLWVVVFSFLILVFHPVWIYGGGGGDCGVSMANGAKFTTVLVVIGFAHQLRAWLINRRN